MIEILLNNLNNIAPLPEESDKIPRNGFTCQHEGHDIRVDRTYRAWEVNIRVLIDGHILHEDQPTAEEKAIFYDKMKALRERLAFEMDRRAELRQDVFNRLNRI